MPLPFRIFGAGGKREGDTSFTRTQFDTRADFKQSLVGVRTFFDVLPTPAFVAGGTFALAPTATSISPSTPAATAVGHYLMAFVTTNDFLTNPVTAPAGWTLLRVEADRGGGAINASYVFTRIAAASGAASVAFTASTATNMGAVIFAFSDVDSGIPVNATAVNAGDAAVINYTAASIDAPSAASLYVAVRLIATANHQRTQTFSADVTQNYSSGLTGAGSFGAYVGSKTLATAGISASTTSFATDGAAAPLTAAGVFFTFALRAVGTAGTSVFVSKQLVAPLDDGSADTTAATMSTGFLGLYPYDAGDPKNLNVARFALDTPISAGATIEKAKLNFATRLAITVAGAMTSVIQAERAIAPARLGTYADYTARTWTTANVSWSIAGTYAIDDPVSSPDITSIVQAVATEFSGSPLSAISIRMATQTGGSLQRFVMWSIDGKASKAVTLEVTYRAAASGNTTVTGTGIASAEAFGVGSIPSGATVVTGTGISSAEAFGAAAITLGAVSVTGTGISSAEAFGSGSISSGATVISGVGITTAEAFGAGTVSSGATIITGTGIASGEAFGAGVITLAGSSITGVGIATGEAFGAGSATLGAISVTGVGISSLEAFGTGVISNGATIVSGVGIASLEAFGAGSITLAGITVTGAGIASAEAFGVGAVTLGSRVVTGTGITSGEAFGVGAVTAGAVTISGAGISSLEAFGTGAIAITGTGIPSGEAFGLGTITSGATTVTGAGITSGEAFGAGVVSSGAGQIIGTGIASGEAFGAGSITAGAISVTGSGIASGEAFGAGSVTRGAVTITGAGIATGEAFGSGSVTSGSSTVTGTGIASQEALGAGSVTRGAVTLTGSSIASAEAFGAGSITISANAVTGVGIISGEAFGAGSVTGGVASITITVRRAEKPAVIVIMRTAAGVSVKQATRAAVRITAQELPAVRVAGAEAPAIRTTLDTNGGANG